MAEQRVYFVASVWAQGGCTTLYQLPEEGRKVLLLLNHFHLCVFSLSLVQSDWTPTERACGLGGSCASWSILFDSKVALRAYGWLGGGSRFSVRMQWPSLAADGLHYIRTAFQFKTKRQHCCEMDYSQQRWIHFVAAVVPDEASGFPLPAVKWCLALPWVLPREVIVHWSDLQAHYLPVFHPKEPGVLSMI